MNELKPVYEAVDGSRVSDEWEERKVCVPAKWVREQVRLPARYQYATLHTSVAELYRPVVRDLCLRYVLGWPEVRAKGLWLNLLGESGAGKTHASAAVLNDVLGNFGQIGGITTYWLSASWGLAELLDYRHFGRQEEYSQTRKRIYNADLLVVDDLGHAASQPSVREFLFGLYDYRYQKKLPTVTTANVRVAPDDWSSLHTIFNEPFARRLRDQGKGYTVAL